MALVRIASSRFQPKVDVAACAERRVRQTQEHAFRRLRALARLCMCVCLHLMDMACGTVCGCLSRYIDVMNLCACGGDGRELRARAHITTTFFAFAPARLRRDG